jgi:pimeloyl-ACP methyl ester carboxylesterase
VVLEAGFSDDGRAWTPLMPALAAVTHVVAYDRAGLGASDPDPELPTVDRRLAGLTALIAHVGPGRRSRLGSRRRPRRDATWWSVMPATRSRASPLTWCAP